MSIKQVRLWLPLIVIMVMSIFLWKNLHSNLHIISSPLIDKQLPTLAAERLLHPTQQVTNRDFIGHVSLLNVFATWCSSCRLEHSVMMDIHQAHQVKIFGLNYKDSRWQATQWLAKYGNPYTKVIYDPIGRIGINLGVYGTPETFLIDQQGIVRYKYVGPLTKIGWQETLLPIVKKLINGA